MGTGNIQDFRKPNPNQEGQQQDGIQRLSHMQPPQSVQVVGGGGYTPTTENPGPDEPEITVHAETSTRLFERVVSDEDKLRTTVRQPNEPEVVVRDGISQIEWRDDVKRGDDE